MDKMKTILMLPKAASTGRISVLYFNEGVWFAASEQDKEYISQDSTEELSLISEEELYQKIPFLRNRLIDDEGMFIYIDHESGRVNINPKHKKKNPFIDDDYPRATNQVNIDISIKDYFRNRRVYLIKVFCILTILILSSIFISLSILILLFWFVFYCYFRAIADCEIFNQGTLNPGIVITKNPTRIAVFTDLSMGFGNYPLVRVYKARLPKKYNSLNSRIPVAGAYQTTIDEAYWDYYKPIPLMYGVSNNQILSQKLSDIPNKHWVLLKNWIKENQDNFYEGYYPITSIKNDWAKVEEPYFTMFYNDPKPTTKT